MPEHLEAKKERQIECATKISQIYHFTFHMGVRGHGGAHCALGPLYMGSRVPM